MKFKKWLSLTIIVSLLAPLLPITEEKEVKAALDYTNGALDKAWYRYQPGSLTGAFNVRDNNLTTSYALGSGVSVTYETKDDFNITDFYYNGELGVTIDLLRLDNTVLHSFTPSSIVDEISIPNIAGVNKFRINNPTGAAVNITETDMLGTSMVYPENVVFSPGVLSNHFSSFYADDATVSNEHRLFDRNSTSTVFRTGTTGFVDIQLDGNYVVDKTVMNLSANAGNTSIFFYNGTTFLGSQVFTGAESNNVRTFATPYSNVNRIRINTPNVGQVYDVEVYNVQPIVFTGGLLDSNFRTGSYAGSYYVDYNVPKDNDKNTSATLQTGGGVNYSLTNIFSVNELRIASDVSGLTIQLKDPNGSIINTYTQSQAEQAISVSAEKVSSVTVINNTGSSISLKEFDLYGSLKSYPVDAVHERGLLADHLDSYSTGVGVFGVEYTYDRNMSSRYEKTATNYSIIYQLDAGYSIDSLFINSAGNSSYALTFRDSANAFIGNATIPAGHSGYYALSTIPSNVSRIYVSTGSTMNDFITEIEFYEAVPVPLSSLTPTNGILSTDLNTTFASNGWNSADTPKTYDKNNTTGSTSTNAYTNSTIQYNFRSGYAFDIDRIFINSEQVKYMNVQFRKTNGTSEYKTFATNGYQTFSKIENVIGITINKVTQADVTLMEFEAYSAPKANLSQNGAINTNLSSITTTAVVNKTYAHDDNPNTFTGLNNGNYTVNLDSPFNLDKLLVQANYYSGASLKVEFFDPMDVSLGSVTYSSASPSPETVQTINYSNAKKIVLTSTGNVIIREFDFWGTVSAPAVLDMTMPSVSNFTNITLNGSVQKTYAQVGNMTITDDTLGTNGYTLKMSATQFKEVGGVGYTLPLNSLKISGISSVVPQTGASGSLPVAASGMFTIDNGASTTLLSASPNQGKGSYVLSFPSNALELTLNPESTFVDKVNYSGVPTPYESTIEINLTAGP